MIIEFTNNTNSKRKQGSSSKVEENFTISMLIDEMNAYDNNNNYNDEHQRTAVLSLEEDAAENDNISCLTQSSYLLSDIYEPRENGTCPYYFLLLNVFLLFLSAYYFAHTSLSVFFLSLSFDGSFYSDVILLSLPLQTNSLQQSPLPSPEQQQQEAHHTLQYKNVRFQRLLEDYAVLYNRRSSSSFSEQSNVVAEVVRIWRSQEPIGRFLVPTKPYNNPRSSNRSSSGDDVGGGPYHDVGDETARDWTSRLLLAAAAVAAVENNSNNHSRESVSHKSSTFKNEKKKSKDDRTNSTSGSYSSKVPSLSSSSCTSSSNQNNHDNTTTSIQNHHRQQHYQTQQQQQREQQHGGDCFGGNFRMVIMRFFAKQSDDGNMNLFLP